MDINKILLIRLSNNTIVCIEVHQYIIQKAIIYQRLKKTRIIICNIQSD